MQIRCENNMRLALSTCCLLVFLSGCSRTRSEAEFLPAENKARLALETALKAWQDGKTMGLIESTKPAVQVIDNKWQAGQKLAGFEILEAETGPGPQWFKVKLNMKAPAGEMRVRYVVAGIDPLWVYREEDFKKAAGTGGGM